MIVKPEKVMLHREKNIADAYTRPDKKKILPHERVKKFHA